MKKIIITLLVVFSVGIISAQDEDYIKDDFTDDEPKEVLKNDNGETILPQAGDISVGINLVPFMNYIGNIGNDNIINGFPQSSFLFDNGTMFFFKYYLSDETAVRAKLGVNFGNSADDMYVQDDAAVYANPLSEDQVVDRMTSSNHAYMLFLGYEKHRDKGRIRAAYGVEASFGYYNSGREYSYGNEFTEINTTPTTFDFNTNTPANVNRRSQTDQNINGIGFGGNLFLELEYYFLPNIAIGTEFAFGPHFTKNNQMSHTDEYWNGSSVQTQTLLDSPGDYDLNVDFFRPTASLFLMINF